jgi:hypothetical protein
MANSLIVNVILDVALVVNNGSRALTNHSIQQLSKIEMCNFITDANIWS